MPKPANPVSFAESFMMFLDQQKAREPKLQGIPAENPKTSNKKAIQSQSPNKKTTNDKPPQKADVDRKKTDKNLTGVDKNKTDAEPVKKILERKKTAEEVADALTKSPEKEADTNKEQHQKEKNNNVTTDTTSNEGGKLKKAKNDVTAVSDVKMDEPKKKTLRSSGEDEPGNKTGATPEKSGKAGSMQTANVVKEEKPREEIKRTCRTKASVKKIVQQKSSKKMTMLQGIQKKTSQLTVQKKSIRIAKKTVAQAAVKKKMDAKGKEDANENEDNTNKEEAKAGINKSGSESDIEAKKEMLKRRIREAKQQIQNSRTQLQRMLRKRRALEQKDAGPVGKMALRKRQKMGTKEDSTSSSENETQVRTRLARKVKANDNKETKKETKDEADKEVTFKLRPRVKQEKKEEEEKKKQEEQKIGKEKREVSVLAEASVKQRSSPRIKKEDDAKDAKKDKQGANVKTETEKPVRSSPRNEKSVKENLTANDKKPAKQSPKQPPKQPPSAIVKKTATFEAKENLRKSSRIQRASVKSRFMRTRRNADMVSVVFMNQYFSCPSIIE